MANSLPVNELAALVGDKEADQLMAAYGGTCLAIPKLAYSALHPIARIIGLEALRKLSHAYGGETVEVPTGMSHAIAVRNHDIATKKKEGLSNKALARMFGLSQRQIGTIVRANRHPKEQGHE